MSKSKVKFLIIAAALLFLFLGVRLAEASTNVTSTTCCHWAWDDSIGWIDFYNTQTITVSSYSLTGYASSSAGYISLDCHTSPNGNICNTSNYQVLNDGLGDLSGWAWNDSYGWISICGNQGGTGGCASTTYSYQVLINPNTGNFSNYAWNDTVGWISFCGGSGTVNCPGSVSYWVNSAWLATSTQGTLDSSTFDTGVAQGAQLNSILWQGNLPSGTSVSFQIAASNSSSGPWTFVGNDGTSNSYYTPTGYGVSWPLGYTFHNNFRYFRYRAYLISDQTQRYSPRVDDVIINWSP